MMKILHKAQNNAISLETIPEICFHTLILLNSTYSSTIWSGSAIPGSAHKTIPNITAGQYQYLRPILYRIATHNQSKDSKIHLLKLSRAQY